MEDSDMSDQLKGWLDHGLIQHLNQEHGHTKERGCSLSGVQTGEINIWGKKREIGFV
jgi:hypothetical protein